jgi:hypothetical protein
MTRFHFFPIYVLYIMLQHSIGCQFRELPATRAVAAGWSHLSQQHSCFGRDGGFKDSILRDPLEPFPNAIASLQAVDRIAEVTGDNVQEAQYRATTTTTIITNVRPLKKIRAAGLLPVRTNYPLITGLLR